MELSKKFFLIVFKKVYSLGTTNQRQLLHVLVGELEEDGFALRAAVCRSHFKACLKIDVRYLDLSGENIPVPVVLHGGCGLRGLFTWSHKKYICITSFFITAHNLVIVPIQ